MCVSCRERKEKSDLIKIAKTPDGFKVDKSCKLFGRGAYVCRNAECVEKAAKKRLFDRSFKQKLPEFVYEELRSVTEKQ